jgi:hypothetical protein
MRQSDPRDQGGGIAPGWTGLTRNGHKMIKRVLLEEKWKVEDLRSGRTSIILDLSINEANVRKETVKNSGNRHLTNK